MNVTYWVDEQPRAERYSVRSLDLSEDGIFIKVDTPLGLGTGVMLQFQLPGTDHELCIRGMVAWVGHAKRDPREPSERFGKGIQFLDVEKGARAILQEYLQGQQLSP